MANTFEAKTGPLRYPVRSAHAGGRALGRENSLETVQKSLTYKNIDEIEVDVRKSRDGVLYCHHGSIPFGVILSMVLRHFTFSRIQGLIGPVDKLETIAGVIPPKTGFYLDIKESGVTSEDLRRALENCASGRIWIACYNIRQLVSLMALGNRHIYVYNGLFFRASKFRDRQGPDLVVNLALDFFSGYLPKNAEARIAERFANYLPRWRVFDLEKKKFVPFPKIVWTTHNFLGKHHWHQ
jgi:glycerophosphoryl diester phosphodiesterase